MYLLSHIVEMLCGVNTSAKRCSPASSVHTSTLVFRALVALPVDQQRNCVLGLRDTVVGFASSNTGSSRSDDTSWVRQILKEPRTNVDVVTRQIIRNIRVLSSPSAEGLELVLWLGHPC